jgi:hypothetical protein
MTSGRTCVASTAMALAAVISTATSAATEAPSEESAATKAGRAGLSGGQRGGSPDAGARGGSGGTGGVDVAEDLPCCEPRHSRRSLSHLQHARTCRAIGQTGRVVDRRAPAVRNLVGWQLRHCPPAQGLARRVTLAIRNPEPSGWERPYPIGPSPMAQPPRPASGVPTGASAGPTVASEVPELATSARALESISPEPASRTTGWTGGSQPQARVPIR